ncbi:MAG: hypothetical protein VX672_08550 [Planctomycetota bacterium]|nr:hypothetical protein [Planctomycetota bacterium]
MYRPFAALAVSLSFVAGSQADLVNPLVPEWRGDAGTSYYQWDSFTQAFGAPNFPDNPGPPGAGLYNFQSGAVIADSGNMYGANGLNIHIYPMSEDAAPAPVSAVLNISTIGTTLSLDTVQGYLGPPMAGGQYFDYSSSEVRYSEAMGPMGVMQTVSFTFDFSSWSGGDTTFGFFFKGEMDHISLDAVSLDINYVPAPGALALIGLAGLGSRRRR